jgi:hypothetical protein
MDGIGGGAIMNAGIPRCGFTGMPSIGGGWESITFGSNKGNSISWKGVSKSGTMTVKARKVGMYSPKKHQ